MEGGCFQSADLGIEAANAKVSQTDLRLTGLLIKNTILC